MKEQTLPVKEKDGIINRVMGVSRDVTEQMLAERRLTGEKEFTDSVINAMPGVFYLFDQNGKFIKWNKTLAELSGLEFNDIGSKSPLDFIASKDREKISGAIKTAFIKGSVFVEADFLSKGGKNIPFYFTGKRIFVGKQPLLLGVGIDISRRKIAEKEKESALFELNVRIKEITCLYKINELFRKSENAIDKILGEIVHLIPSGWSNPQKTGAEILFDGETYSSIDFEESKMFRMAKIVVDNIERGLVKVSLDNSEYKYQFLKDEEQLLNEISYNISLFITNKENEDALIDSERKFKAMVKESPMAKMIVDMDGNIEYVNDNFNKILGYSVEDIPSIKTWSDKAYPDPKYRKQIIEKWDNEFNRAVNENRSTNIVEANIYCKNGKHRVFELVGNLIGDILLIVFNDITERKLAQEERDNFFGVSLGLLCIAGSDGFFKELNPAWEETLGWTLDELKSKPFLEFLHPDDVEETLQEVVKLNAGIPTINFQNRYKHKNGTYRYLNWVTSQIKGVMYSSATDITLLKEAEANLINSEQRFKSLYHNSPVSIWDEDWTEVISMINELKLKEIVNYSEYFENNESFVLKALSKVKIVDVNKETLEMFEADNKEDFRNSLDVVFATEETLPGFVGELIALAEGNTEYQTEMKLNTAKGNLIETLLRMTFPSDKDPTGQVLVSLMNITPLKEAEEKLIKIMLDLKRSNQELEQFAYVASHDLQEPLRMVSSYTQLLERRYKEQLDQDAKDFINYAVDGANRMQILINDLLQYSRVTTRGKEFEKCDLNSLLGQAIANVKGKIMDSSAVITNEELPDAAVDAGQIVRVFQNLITNGLKYRSDESPRIHISSEIKSDKIIISIKDNGIGIAHEYHQRIFEIFERLHTKEKYEGTGIGLAICKRIIERHGEKFGLNRKKEMAVSFILRL